MPDLHLPGQPHVPAARPPADTDRGLSIADSTTGTRHTLKLRGELDMASVADLYAATTRIAPLAREIILDLSDLTFMDSSGLQLILSLRTHCRRQRCRLLITSANPQVRRLFEVTGLLAPMREQGLLGD